MSKRTKDDSSLVHTRWNCKYHIVSTPKYRRKIIYDKLRAGIGRTLRILCELKDVEILEAHAMPDHIHMLVKIPPKMSVSAFMGCLKGRSSNNSRTTCQFKIQLRQSKLLVLGILCEYSRFESKNDC